MQIKVDILLKSGLVDMHDKFYEHCKLMPRPTNLLRFFLAALLYNR